MESWGRGPGNSLDLMAKVEKLKCDYEYKKNQTTTIKWALTSTITVSRMHSMELLSASTEFDKSLPVRVANGSIFDINSMRVTLLLHYIHKLYSNELWDKQKQTEWYLPLVHTFDCIHLSCINIYHHRAPYGGFIISLLRDHHHQHVRQWNQKTLCSNSH